MKYHIIILRALFSFYILKIIKARCPNRCSGHGICGSKNLCTCFEGWNGGAIDCSLAICPTGIAWVDKAYDKDFGHQLTECSNAGICDRTTGNCKCIEGFTGHACQRNKCPNDCSGHGECTSIRDISINLGPDYNPTSSLLIGDGWGQKYNNWDKNSMFLCECEEGYFSSDCSQRMCPKGDDPITINQYYRSISLTIIETGYYDLKESCTVDLSNNGKFGEVLCVLTKVNRQHFIYTLTFLSWPLFPKDNNFFSHFGNPSIDGFYCDVSELTGEVIDTKHHSIAFTTSCVFKDLVASDIREYNYCSNRGICDFTMGDCKCTAGFGGAACNIPTYLYHQSTSTSPGVTLDVNLLDFQSSVLEFNSITKSQYFNFLEGIADGEVLLKLQGNGNLEINELQVLIGGETIHSGGLYVTNGMSLFNNGLSVYSEDIVKPVVALTNSFIGPLGSGNSMLRINTMTSTPSLSNAIEVKNKGDTKFLVGCDGMLRIISSGLSVTGGGTVYRGGLTVTGGMSIRTGGLLVKNSGMVVVSGGVTIYGDGLKILSGGLQVTSGATIYSGGLAISADGNIINGGLSVRYGGVTSYTGGFTVSGGITVGGSSGIVVTGGLTINSGGLFVRTEGLTIYSGGFAITGSVTIIQGGFFVTNGMSIYSNGINVVAGGLTALNSGIRAYTGATVSSGGFTVTGGISVNDAGVYLTGGLTVFDSGMYIIGGITVDGPGLRVLNGGIHLRNAWIGNGMDVQRDGLFVNAGLTSSALYQTFGITGNSVLAGVTITNNLYVVGDMTVQGALKTQYGTILTASDRNLKTNLIPITEALDKVSKLKGVYFDWIKDEVVGIQFDNKRHVGVIAQNVLDVLPEAVDRKDGSNYLGVDYTAMVPLLIEAMHELEEQISKLNEEDRNSNVVNNNTLNNDNKLEVLWSEMQKMHLEFNLLKAKNELLEKENISLKEDIAIAIQESLMLI